MNVFVKRFNSVFQLFLQTLKDELEIPLYYTGLSTKAFVIFEGNRSNGQDFQLSRDYKITIPINLEPKSYTWILIE